MKFQESIKQWATKIMGYPITTLNQIQNSQFIIKMLHQIQPSQFKSDWNINQRSSNSLNNIMNQISSYYKRELSQNISHIIDNINVFKNVIEVWELLVGIAVKGKNRDNNINIILQMEQELQSQMMNFVQQIIQKYGEQVCSQMSQEQGSQNNRKRSSSIRQMNQTNQMLAELMEQVQTLKQKNIQLITELQVNKFSNQQIKKGYQSRIQKYKNQRYDFLQVITNYNGQSKSKIISSSVSNDSQDFSFSVTGSLSQIANDLLNVIKRQKKENQRQLQKINLLEQMNKDLKQAYHRVTDENTDLKKQIQQHSSSQQELQKLRIQKITSQKNQNQLIKKINQIQEQKFFLREIIQKNKIQYENILKNQRANKIIKTSIIQQNDNVQQKKGNQLDFLKIPKIITNNLSQISQSNDGQYLSKEIDEVRQPVLRQKLMKQIKYLKQNILVLKQQNQSLKNINQILQNTIHLSTIKTFKINQNLNEQFQKLFIEQKQNQKKLQQNNQLVKQSLLNSTNQKIINQNQEETQQIKFTIKVLCQKKQISSQEFIIQDKQLSPKKIGQNQQNQNSYLPKIQIKQPTICDANSEIQYEKLQQKNVTLEQNREEKISQIQIQDQKINNLQKDLKLKKLYVKMKDIINKYENKELILNIQIQSLRKELQIIKNQKNCQLKEKKDIEKQSKNFINSDEVNTAKIQKQSMIKNYKIQTDQKSSDNNKYLDRNYQNTFGCLNIQQRSQNQYNQIKQGEDLNQNQLEVTPKISIKSHIFNMNSQIVHDMVQRNIQKSTLQFLKPKRVSKYNKSFMELNSMLQSQFQAQVQNLMQILDTKKHDIKQQKNDILKKKQQLLSKLNQIQISTQKLSKMYQSYTNKKQQNNTRQVQNLINELQQIRTNKNNLQKQQIVALKITNQGLKQLLNEMLSQKQATYHLIGTLKMNMVKPLITEQSIIKLFQDLQTFQHLKLQEKLENIMKNLFQSEKQQKQKISFYEQLYLSQKQKNNCLSSEINLLMESLVFFRNLALEQ